MEYPLVKLYGTLGVDQPTIEEGVLIDEGTKIGQNTYIGMNVRIGKNCRIMQHVTICKDSVIGDEVFIGPNTTLLNDKYPPTKVSQPPIINSGAIIGGGATILPAVIVGLKAVIGAGATVTRDVKPGTVVCGNPARVVMSRSEYDDRQTELLERLG